MENNDKQIIIDQIEEVLEAIRPYIQNDGGDVEFVDFTDDGIVQIRLLGACVGCSMVDITVTQGIEQSLVEEIPGVIGVDVVEDFF